MRVFKNFYYCDECPLEWDTELLTRSADWCPCCDKSTEAYCSEEFEQEMADVDAE
jgi:hypothetical protein